MGIKISESDLNLSTDEFMRDLILDYGGPIKVNYNETTNLFAIIRETATDTGVTVFGSGKTLESAMADFTKSVGSLNPFFELQQETVKRFLGDEYEELEEMDIEETLEPFTKSLISGNNKAYN